MNNRHHPYGGYDDRSARGGAGAGRGGGPMAGRGRPPHSSGMSPPPPNASAAYPQPGPYDPSSVGVSNDVPYYNKDPYAASSDFSGGADRHYPAAPAGPMSMRGGARGGMPMRGGFGGRPATDPRMNQGRPMPHHGVNPERSPSAPFAQGGYDTAYGASKPYEQPGAPQFNQGRPPYNARPMQPPPNMGGGMPPANYPQARPPPQAGPLGAPPQHAGMGGPAYGNQFGPGGGQNFGGPRPPPPGPGYGGGGMGGPRGGGFNRPGGQGGGVRDSANEKPCRTLFVRNVQFETDSKTVKAQFEQFGEIKTFFDMVNKRGIAFITYYDLRAAHAAMEGMRGTHFGSRPIDIHYSLPREEDKAQRCDRDKNQGTLFAILKQTGEKLTEEIIYQVFGEFGDVKSLRDYKDQVNCRFVEYFDSRACQTAHDQLNGKSFMGGTWELKYAWDSNSKEPGPGPGFGPAASAAPGARPGAQWNRPPMHAQPTPAPISDRAPLPPGYRGFEDKPQNANANYGNYGGAPAAGYGNAPVPSTGAPVDSGWGSRSSATPSADVPSQPDANRLEQAQKVQQLLASLGAASKTPAPSAPVPTSAPAAPAPAARAHASLSPPPPAGALAAPGLPANIAALLQQASGPPKAQVPKAQSPPTAQSGDNGQQSMHQLLSMLNQSRPPPPPPQ